MTLIDTVGKAIDISQSDHALHGVSQLSATVCKTYTQSHLGQYCILASPADPSAAMPGGRPKLRRWRHKWGSLGTGLVLHELTWRLQTHDGKCRWPMVRSMWPTARIPCIICTTGYTLNLGSVWPRLRSGHMIYSYAHTYCRLLVTSGRGWVSARCNVGITVLHFGSICGVLSMTTIIDETTQQTWFWKRESFN